MSGDSVRLHLDAEDRFTDESVDTQDDDDVVEVDPAEVAWHKFLDMVPNCYGRSKLSLEAPPLDLLPYRSWPAKTHYTLVVDKVAASNRPR